MADDYAIWDEAQRALVRLADLAELREIESRIPAIIRKYGLDDVTVRGRAEEQAEAEVTVAFLSSRRDELLAGLWPAAYSDEPARKPHVRLDVEEVIDYLYCCDPAGASIAQVAANFSVSEATARRKLDGAVGRGKATIEDGLYHYYNDEEE